LNKTSINIVWFKRDLRFTDNEAFFNAHHSGLPLLLVYFFEPSVMHYDDSDTRHWRFVYESLQDLQKKLNVIDAKIYIFQSEIQPIFSALLENYDIKTVFVGHFSFYFAYSFFQTFSRLRIAVDKTLDKCMHRWWSYKNRHTFTSV